MHLIGNNIQVSNFEAQNLLNRAEMYIITRYPNLVNLNSVNFGISEKISPFSRFFIIKSFSEEDVHKGIKYKVWCSTRHGNLDINKAYHDAKSKGGEVYLFYSCNGSGRYVGVAKLTSPLDENNTFKYWTQDSKWAGLFDIEFVFIKDVPFRQFKSIQITMKDGQTKPVTFSRDSQEVPFNEGKLMLKYVEEFVNSNTILEHFEYYDIRQENYEKTLQGGQVNQFTQNSPFQMNTGYNPYQNNMMYNQNMNMQGVINNNVSVNNNNLNSNINNTNEGTQNN